MKTIDEFENMLDDAKCAIDDCLENDYEPGLFRRARNMLEGIIYALSEAGSEIVDLQDIEKE